MADILSFFNVLVWELCTWVVPMLEVLLRAFLRFKMVYGPRNEPVYSIYLMVYARLLNYDIYLGKLIETLKTVFLFP